MDIYDELLDAQAPAAPAAPQGPATPDVYDSLLDQHQAAQRQRLQLSLDQALKVVPQKAASVQQLSQSTGLPAELVERNLDDVQRQVRLQELQSLLADSPILARQMGDPQFAALAQQDVQNLSLIERIPRQFGGGATEMVGRTVSGIGALANVAQRNLLAGLGNLLLPEPRSGGQATVESLAGPLIGEDWRSVGGAVEDFARNDLMIPALQQTFGDQVVAGLGQVGAQVVAHLLTGGAVGTASMYAQGADIMADRVENDPASQGMKDLAVLGGAAVTGLTEKWAFDRLMGPLSTPVKNQIGAALTRIGIAGASEGVQEMAENLAHESLRKLLTNPEAEISLGGAFEEGQVGAAVGTIVRSIVEGALHVRVRQAQREQDAQNAEQNAQALAELTQLAQASELLKVSPESFEQFIAAASEDGQVQSVFIDAQTLLQSGVAEQLAAVSPAVAQQIQTAAATGGQVQIPLAEYASKIAPTEYAQSLLEHLKTDPRGFSLAEARDYLQNQASELEAEVEQIVAGQEGEVDFKASQERVKQTVLDELNTLGRFTAGKNELDATLIAARTAVRAAQLGMTPEQMFERQRVRFAAERIDGQGFDQGRVEARDLAAQLAEEFPGLKLDLMGRGDKATLSRIVVPEEGRSAGTGTQVMQRIVQWADANGVTVSLTPSSDFGGNKKRLVEFYKRFGFVENKGRNKDYEISEAMYRPAQVLNQSAQSVIDTPAFREWFGDSKVVDANGKPLVVYHGTPTGGFTEFDVARLGTGGGLSRGGFSFTTDLGAARGYAGTGTDEFARLAAVADAANAVLDSARPTQDMLNNGQADEDGISHFDDSVFDSLDDLQESIEYFAGILEADGQTQVAADLRAAMEAAPVGASSVYEVFLRVPPEAPEFYATPETLAKVVAGLDVRNVPGRAAVVHLPDGNRIYYVADPEQIKSAIGNKGDFDPNDPNIYNQGAQAPRGAFNPETTTIALLKNADLSTFLHEAGHYFFESDIALAADLVSEGRTFGENTHTEGEQQILRDVSALLRWHGIDGPIEDQLNQWYTMSFEEKRAAHERTAESFEAYLFEGNAPSIELQSYFQQFRAWLLNVYRSLKDFLARNPEAGKLNDAVRAIFDRMLATTEQIQLAQQGRSMLPLFRTEAEAGNVGMTPEEFAQYQATDLQASQDAIEQVQQRGLRDLQWTRNAHNREVKKLQRRAADLRRQARMDVRAEVMTEPVYRAWQFLTGRYAKPVAERPKSDPNVVDPAVDSLLTAVAKLGGLNKQAAVDEWGVDPAERPNSGVFGKPVLRAGDEGRTPDAMAEALGELGYLPLDEDGKVDLRDFESRFDAALRGEDVYSNQVDADRVFGAEMPGAGLDLDQLTAGRLDSGALRELDISDETRRALQSRKMTHSDGIHPDLLAPLFGFDSGVAMVEALADATPPREEIEARTDARLLEEHGELATPEAIEREADKAIHNEARARMIATEANALAQATGRRRILTTAAKQFAQVMVARLKVRDVRPHQYTSAEVRAAKAAERASRAGDLPTAAAEKRNQLVNTYAAKAAYDAQAEVDKGLRYLKKFASDGVRKKLDADYLEQIDTLLERFDLRTGQSLKAIDKRTTLAQWVAGMEADGLEPDLPDYILAEANRTHYKDLTVEQFRGLVESVQQIEHLGRLKKRLLTAKDNRELDTIVAEIKGRIEDASGGRIVDNEKRNTARSWLTHLGRGLLASHRKAASVARELDGFTDGGPMWEYLIRSMNAAGDREASLRADASRRLQELAAPILKGEKMGGEGRLFPTLGRRLNRGERLAIALNWGNASNRQRLLGGRGWTEQQLQPVLASLTSAEWTFVQGVWDFFESYRPEIAAKERRVYGKEPQWIDPAPFAIRTADGQELQVRGGYYPIKYDPAQSGKASQHAEAEEAKAMMRAAYTAATTRRSFTKTRAEEVVGRPLLLTFDGIWQGANEVIHDLTWHEWLIDANRLMSRLDGSIRQHYGAEKVDVIRKAVKDSARGDIPAMNQLEKTLTHLRNGTSIVGMGWNVTTALLQPLGLTNSIVRVGGQWIAKGMVEFYGSPTRMAEVARDVQARSPMMAERARTMNREIADVRNQLVEGKSQARTAVEASFFVMIQKLQAGVDYPTWLGAYEKAIADPANLNADGTVNEARAVALADQAVLDAQGGGQLKDLAEVQRGHPAMKLFTNFYSYFNVLFNLTYERTANTDFKRPKEVAALMGDYLLLMVLPAIGSAVLRNVLKGEDDEDEYLKDIASELVGYPFGMFVLLRDVAGAAQVATGVGNPAFGYAGPAGLRFFAELHKLGQQANQGEVDMALFKAANNTAGILFHYPAGQVNRLVDGTAALIEGRTENPLAPLVGPPPR